VSQQVSSLASPRGRKPPTKGKKYSKTSENKRQGYLQRSSGIKTKRKKPPKWEKEGDELFFLHQDKNKGTVDDSESSFDDSELLKARFDAKDSVLAKDPDKKGPETSKKEDKKGNPASKFMWGAIPTGPILSPKLNKLFNQPTPIQSKAFSLLSKSGATSSNVVIASPTGSGKTLAFLLPLIANTKRDAFGRILIITPTMDLAYQIQRVVDQLWDPINNYSGLYVVKPPQTSGGDDDDDYVIDSDQVQSWTISEMKMCKSPIIAGTPKSLMQLLTYCKDKKINLLGDLGTVVLDEADRLLQTEHVARGDGLGGDSPALQALGFMKKMGVTFDVRTVGGAGGSSFGASGKKRYDSPLSRARLVCASATVGRTLRRQMMEITNASSIDKAADLVVADDRTGKDEKRRRNSLLPASIQHMYSLYDGEGQVIDGLYTTMRDLPPAPTLIFPGKTGVANMVEELQARGLEDVNTLRDNMHFSDEEDGLDESDAQQTWEQSPIYVVGEKFGRGLDIPNVKYVFLAAPPTSPAAYAHLAGRTGRGGNEGTAITMVQGMKDTKRLISLSEILGIDLSSAVKDSSANEMDTKKEKEDGDLKSAKTATTKSNVDASKATNDLNKLSVVELKEILRERSLKVSGRKAELIERLQA